MPELSVVLAVHNEADTLEETLGSIDQQTGVDFEVIVVDDGSDDATTAMLDRHATSRPRYRVFQQSRQGLTAALILGCSKARSPFIARHDGGDRSTPGRFARQLHAIQADRGIAMVSSITEVFDDRGNLLYVSAPDKDDPDSGPSHHGCTVFRRDIYERVGGYRRACYVAQDLDLWLRLVRHGRHARLDVVDYQATIRSGSISVGRRVLQERVASLLNQAAVARYEGRSEQTLMDEVYRVSREPATGPEQARSDFHYFAASCLRRHNPAAARRHLRSALRARPFHWRAVARYLETLLHRPSERN